MKKFAWSAIGIIGSLYIGIFSFTKNAFAELEFDPGGEIKKATDLPDPEGGPPELIIRYIQVLLGFLGLMGVLMIIIGGYNWMMAGGNEEKVKKAKDLIKNTIIGMIVVLLSWMLVAFIFGRVDQLAS